MKLYMFRTFLLSIIRSFSLYAQQWFMSCRYANSLQVGSGSWSCSQAVSKPVWHIPLLCVQWKTHDDGQQNCPKHVEFHSKKKFEKLVHLFGFIIRKIAVIAYRRFGNWNCENRPETSVSNYHYSLRNYPEEHSSQCWSMFVNWMQLPVYR